MRTIRHRWRWRRFVIAACAYTLGAAHADESTALSNQVASCEGCHQGAKTLAGKPVGDVTAMIRVIADGDSRHPPVNITLDLDDHNVEALAKALTGTQ